MLLAGTSLKGFAIHAEDGKLGKVSDFLFDDRTWKLRWLVVDTIGWLSGRLILLHPSVIGMPDFVRQEVQVRLTKAQIEAGPNMREDAPVSRKMEDQLYGYYGWSSMWGGSGYFTAYPDATGMPLNPATPYGDLAVAEPFDPPRPSEGDRDLRSLVEITGYDVHATDGMIGHIKDVLIDDADWSIRYLIVDTRNWWPGKHVLVSPYAVKNISWSTQQVEVALTREAVKASPSWDPADIIDREYETRLHRHYGWAGYGW